MIHAKLEAENLAVAEVRSAGGDSRGRHASASERAVHVRIDAGDRWDAAGLRRLSALLRGIAGTLESVESE